MSEVHFVFIHSHGTEGRKKAATEAEAEGEAALAPFHRSAIFLPKVGFAEGTVTLAK